MTQCHTEYNMSTKHNPTPIGYSLLTPDIVMTMPSTCRIRFLAPSLYQTEKEREREFLAPSLYQRERERETERERERERETERDSDMIKQVVYILIASFLKRYNYVK